MARGLMDLVNKYKMGKNIEAAEKEYEATKDAETRGTQIQSMRRLEKAGLGSTPVGYEDPHNVPLWEFEGATTPWDMDRDTYEDYIESGEWNYPHDGSFLDVHEIKTQMMADYDMIHKGRERATDRMDNIIAKEKADYESKSPNLIMAIAKKLGLGD